MGTGLSSGSTSSFTQGNKAYREFFRRRHRIVATYLALQAWRHNLDCIVLDRWALERLFELERFKNSRISWLREDLEPWFPHQWVCYYFYCIGPMHGGTCSLEIT